MTPDAAEPPAAPGATSIAMRGAAVGVGLALCLALPASMGALAFIARLGISPALMVIVVACTAGAVASADRDNAVRTLAIVGVILAVCFGLSALTPDVSFDGQTYHQSAARLLAAGWNPVWAARLHEGAANGRYITSLPKSAWILEAMVYRATGSFEAAKGVQVVAIIAAFLLAWPALEAAGVRRRPAILVAVLAAANPVSLTQAVSFYVDGLVASSLVVVAALMILWLCTGERRWVPALILMTAFLANLKFNGLLYGTFVGLAGAIWLWIHARSRAGTGTLIVATAALVTACAGINPYATNTLAFGNPLYPAMGRGAMHNVVNYDPTFAGRSRVVQFFTAMASESSNIDERAPRLKLPLTVRASEIAAFATLDTRVGGLGPLFSGALLISWALLAHGMAQRRPRARLLALVSLGLFCSGLAIPFGYYSRYAPQLWFAALPALLIDQPLRIGGRILAVLLACNTVLVGAVSLGTQLFVGALHREQLRTLARDAGGGEITYSQFNSPFLNVDLRFAAYGIRARAVQDPACSQPALLLATHVLVCLPDGRSPAPTPDPARVAAGLLSKLGLP